MHTCFLIRFLFVGIPQLMVFGTVVVTSFLSAPAWIQWYDHAINYRLLQGTTVTPTEIQTTYYPEYNGFSMANSTSIGIDQLVERAVTSTRSGPHMAVPSPQERILLIVFSL